MRRFASIKPGQEAAAEIVRFQRQSQGGRLVKVRVLYERTRPAPDQGWCRPCFEARYLTKPEQAAAGPPRAKMRA